MLASIQRAMTFGIPMSDWVMSSNKLAHAVGKVIIDGNATRFSVDVPICNRRFRLIKKLLDCARTGFQMNPIQFEKGDHKNYHMDFIACLANLHARTSSIPEVDRLKAEFIVRRIVPAIATSTALAAGLVCQELYKVLDDRHKVEDFRNAFVNLALSRLTMAKPVPPKVITHHDMSWTIWDRWIITENLMLRELMQWLEVCRISRGLRLLYNAMSPEDINKLDQQVVDLANFGFPT